MEKSKLNLIIDALLSLCIAAVVGIGLLIKYVLVPGYLRWEIYGRNVEIFFWGLDRHQWGTIHLVIGIVFLALLVLHVVLHWPMIISIYRKLIPNRFARWITALILIFMTIFLLAFSYFVKPKVYEQERGKGHGWQQYDISGNHLDH
jgi:hypothetical protein